MGASRSRMPPWMFFDGFGLVCFLVKFTRSTMAVPLVERTRSTRPRLPASLPERTTTVSPLRPCGLWIGYCFAFEVRPYMSVSLDDFRGEGDDLHELPLAELAGHGAEDARAAGLALVVDENGRGVVELDVRDVAAAGLADRADGGRLHDGALLDRAVRRAFLDRGGDDVAHAGILAGRGAAAQTDAGDLLRPRVVCNLQNRSHLNHDCSPVGSWVAELLRCWRQTVQQPSNLATQQLHYDALATTSLTFQRFRFESGRVSSMI